MKQKGIEKAILGILIAITFVLAFNSFQMSKIIMDLEGVSSQSSQSSFSGSSVIPTGVPVYGDEIQFSLDDIDPYDAGKANKAIAKLGNFDRTLTLDSEQMKRFINILYNMYGGISCEYCCGARAVIFENGKPACGCAHSYAMRGLAKYLILNHPDMSDEEILIEVAKVKIRFFPTILEQKAQIMKDQGLEVTPLTLATNKYRGIEKGAKGGAMVGGC